MTPTEPAAATSTELLVCTTCRPADAPREGQAADQGFFDQLEGALAFGPSSSLGPLLRGIACLGTCSRSCTVARQAPGKASYVFGELAPDDDCVQAVLEVAHQHAISVDGLLVWGQRPERLRRGLVSRLPALATRAGSAPGA
jgi:predicted metal-binding protein